MYNLIKVIINGQYDNDESVIKCELVETNIREKHETARSKITINNAKLELMGLL